MTQTVFAYLTTPQGILEHLHAYMTMGQDESDASHYASLKRGVQHVIEALEIHLADDGTQQ